MNNHKFKVGRLVRYTFDRWGGDVYKITHLLPPVDEPQYRIKSENEPYERVVKESSLTGVA